MTALVLTQRLAFPLVVSLLVILGSAHMSYADLIILGKGHAPIYVSDKDVGDFDLNNDGLIDYYVRAHFTGNSNQQYKVDYKIIDECVDGSTYEDAKMKLGFSTTDFFPEHRTWFTNFTAWTPWFKAGENDANKRIDLISPPPRGVPSSFPESGDDIITHNDGDKKGSFTHKNSISQIDGQAGWEGSIFFNASPGKHYMWTILPGDGSSGCELFTGIAITIIIKQ